MAYGYPYLQPNVPGYFNTNYMPPQQPQFQQTPQNAPAQSMGLTQVPDELTALNAQFPMDGSPVFFINANGREIYSKQLSMSNGSVIFHRYKREEAAQKPENGYVTRAEMDAKLDELYQLLGAVTAPANAPEGGQNK